MLNNIEINLEYFFVVSRIHALRDESDFFEVFIRIYLVLIVENEKRNNKRR